MNNPHNLKVGQVVTEVKTLNRKKAEIREYVITKIGRKWFEYGEGFISDRADIDTLVIDSRGFSSPGKIYTDIAKYHEDVERNKKWSEITEFFRHKYAVPSKFTKNDIEELLKIVRKP